MTIGQYWGGEDGEGDLVKDDIEVVAGGAGNDTLVGNDQDNTLRGFGGNDTITGGGGKDALYGDAGADLVKAAGDTAADFVSCGADTDAYTADKADLVNADCERTDVTACDTTITAPGTYRVASNLTCANDAVRIDASDVVLDLNGKTITETGGSAGVAVGHSTHVDGVLVRGPGTITGTNNSAVIVLDASGSRVTGVTTTGNRVGIATLGPLSSGANTLDGNTVTGNEDGFQILGNSDTRVTNNQCSQNSSIGINVESGVRTVLSGNTCNQNHFGIIVGFGVEATVTQNTATQNSDWDLYDRNEDCAGDTWANNTFATANRSCIA